MSKPGASARNVMNDSADDPVIDMEEVRRWIGTLADESPSDDEDSSLESPRRTYLSSQSIDDGQKFQRSHFTLPRFDPSPYIVNPSPEQQNEKNVESDIGKKEAARSNPSM